MKLLTTKEYDIEGKAKITTELRKIENIVIKYNEELYSGKVQVDDNTYTNCVEYIELFTPNSPVLKNNRVVVFIKEFNSDTVRKLKEYSTNMTEYQFILNPEGLNVKLVYEYGALISAVTFGRSLRMQDATELVSRVLTDRNDNLEDIGHIEIEGTLVLPFENMDMANEICTVDNAYQGVFSVIHSGVDDVENYLHFIATDVFIEEVPFGSIDEKYAFLSEYEFLVPRFIKIPKNHNIVYDFESALEQAKLEFNTYEYLTDGLRFLISDKDIVLLKMGIWTQQYFKGIVKSISWEDKGGKKTPRVYLETPIFVQEDTVIESIALAALNLLLILNVEVGKELNFAYLGERGILPLTENLEIICN